MIYYLKIHEKDGKDYYTSNTVHRPTSEELGDARYLVWDTSVSSGLPLSSPDFSEEFVDSRDYTERRQCEFNDCDILYTKWKAMEAAGEQQSDVDAAEQAWLDRRAAIKTDNPKE